MSQWADFRASVSSRFGIDVFFDPRYVDWTPDHSPVFNRPWWACISYFMSHWHDRIFLIKTAWSKEHGWLLWDDNWGFDNHDKTATFWQKIRSRFWWRVFYLMKLTLCVLFLYSRSAPEGRYYDTVDIACYDYHPSGGEYGGYNWQNIAIGLGLFENWFYREYSDSSY